LILQADKNLKASQVQKLIIESGIKKQSSIQVNAYRSVQFSIPTKLTTLNTDTSTTIIGGSTQFTLRTDPTTAPAQKVEISVTNGAWSTAHERANGIRDTNGVFQNEIYQFPLINTFTAAGTYDVYVRSTDLLGRQSIINTQVTITSAAKVPIITGFDLQAVTAGNLTTFIVKGQNLPVTPLDVTFNGCANISFLSQTSIQHTFTCTPQAGNLTVNIREVAGGAILKSYPVVATVVPPVTSTGTNLLLGGTFTDSCFSCPAVPANSLTNGSLQDGQNLRTYSGSFNIFVAAPITLDRLILYPYMSPNGTVSYEIQTSTSPTGAAGTWTSHGVRSGTMANEVPFPISLGSTASGVRVVKVIINSSPSWVALSEVEGFLGSPNTLVSGWCGQNLNFSGGILPSNWTSSLIRSGPGLVNNRLQGDPTDSGVIIESSPISSNPSVNKIVVDYIANHQTSYWGMYSGFEFKTASGSNWSVWITNSQYTSGANIRVRLAKGVLFGGGGTLEFDSDNSYPYTQGTQNVNLEFINGSAKIRITSVSDSSVVASNVALPASFVLSDLIAVRHFTYTNTGASSWSDNLRIQCLP
jgi:hypothetical protein